jgi:hypothetical protein
MISAPVVQARAGLACTAASACGYGTGVGTAVVTAAGEVHGFPAALTSFIGRAGALREVAGVLEEYRLVTVNRPGFCRGSIGRTIGSWQAGFRTRRR